MQIRMTFAKSQSPLFHKGDDQHPADYHRCGGSVEIIIFKTFSGN